MAANDPELRAHRDWINLLQAESKGLVVSPPALVKAQAVAPRNSVELQRRFLAAIAPPKPDEDDDDEESSADPDEPAAGRARRRGRNRGERAPAELLDFPRLARDFLGWEAEDLVGGPAREEREAIPESLVVGLTEYQQVLGSLVQVAPSFSLRGGTRAPGRAATCGFGKGTAEEAAVSRAPRAADG